MTATFTSIVDERPNCWIVACVEELPGANTQGETLEEARENLREAVEVVIEAHEMAQREIRAAR